MTESPGHRLSAEALSWVGERLGRGSRVVAERYLPGSSFHANHALDVVLAGGGRQEVVLRRWTGNAWRDTDAEFDPRREVAVLDVASRASVPAPRVIAADPHGEACGTPALLLTRLPGDHSQRPADESSFVRQIAEVMETIHSADEGARARIPGYRRFRDPSGVSPPRDSRRRDVWEEAIEVARGDPRQGRRCFIHRDFHPGNLLWSDGRLTGVVDWSYGSWGPAAVDVAHMRWNLVVAYGPAVADRFVDAHRAVRGGDTDQDPYWDIVGVLDLLDASGHVAVPNADMPVLEECLSQALRLV